MVMGLMFDEPDTLRPDDQFWMSDGVFVRGVTPFELLQRPLHHIRQIWIVSGVIEQVVCYPMLL